MMFKGSKLVIEANNFFSFGFFVLNIFIVFESYQYVWRPRGIERENTRERLFFEPVPLGGRCEATTLPQMKLVVG